MTVPHTGSSLARTNVTTAPVAKAAPVALAAKVALVAKVAKPVPVAKAVPAAKPVRAARSRSPDRSDAGTQGFGVNTTTGNSRSVRA